MSDPYERDNISVTIKHDGKEGTWIVFHGTPAKVREQIIEVFSLTSEWETPLFDLINEATRIYKATGNVSSQLGGRVIPPSERKSDGDQQGGSAWNRAQGGIPAEPEVDPNMVRLTAQVEAAATRTDLKEMYARNKEAFDSNAELMAAYKTKGKSLPA